MKIVGIDCHVLLIPMVDEAATDSAQDNLVVFIHTDAGVTGVGESDANPWMLKAAIEAQDMDTSTGLYQKFGRRMRADPMKQKAMHDFVVAQQAMGVKTQDAKKMYRLQWLREEMQEVTSVQQYVESYKKIESEKGQMKCFAVLVESLGWWYDPEGAVRRATKY